jgi:hypothetical protein
MMNTNVNLEAAIGVLAFLGTAFVLGLAVLVILHALKTRKQARARKVGLAALTVLGLYLALLATFSFVSGEKSLALGEEKHFCELDCHLAYSVTNIRKTQTLGDIPEKATAARGIFYVVTVRTRFDEMTISSTRGDGLLAPNSRVVTVLDAQGNSYDVSPEGQRALDALRESGTPFTKSLRPGESYTTELAFDLPVEVSRPELLMREGEFVTPFIIGHENSFWHKKTKFRLES